MAKEIRPSEWRASLDIGNAFTSACAYIQDTDTTLCLRIPTVTGDPAASAAGALAALSEKHGLEPGCLGPVVIGSTTFSAAVSHGGGPGVALLITRGFRDILFAGRPPGITAQFRRNGKDRFPVSRRQTYEVNERVLPDGRALEQPDEDEIINLASELSRTGVRSVAVCFLHSCENPMHERRVGEILFRRLPGVPVTLSSDAFPMPGEYRRALATVIYAMTKPLMQRFLDKICSFRNVSEKSPPRIYFLLPDGGVTVPDRVSPENGGLLFSGPAGGFLSSLNMTEITGRTGLIALDMGAVETRICVVRRHHHTRPASRITRGDGPGGTDEFEVYTVPLGGESSIAPGSAVVCPTNSSFCIPYSAGIQNPESRIQNGRGGITPTLAGANLRLGRTGPGLLPSVPTPTDAGTAKAEKASLEIVASANKLLSRALRKATVDRGLDPRECTLMVYGGAGPQHAAELALKLGIPLVLVPRNPGLQSALGMLLSPIRIALAQQIDFPLISANPEHIDATFQRLQDEAGRGLAGGLEPPEDIIVFRSADIRYRGYPYHLNMQFPSGKLKQADLLLINRAFGINHYLEYGLVPDDAEAEIVTLRLTAQVSPRSLPGRPSPLAPGRSGTEHSKPRRYRKVFFHDCFVSTPVYCCCDLHPRSTIKGPAVVDHDYSTTVIWPGMSAVVDSLGNIIIDTGVK